jgi:formylglycine-generating enzyme required for sulfatase activity
MNPTSKPTADNLPRVFRGGSWIRTSAAEVVRAANRNVITPLYRISSIGFRCVLRGREPVGKGST